MYKVLVWNVLWGVHLLSLVNKELAEQGVNSANYKEELNEAP